MPAAQFFERGPSRGALQSQLLGQGLGQVGGELAGRLYQKSQIQDALKNLKDKPGKNPLETAINFMEAGAGIPGFERYAGKLFPLLMQYSEAQAKSGGGVGTDVELGGVQNNVENLSPDDIRAKKIEEKYNVPPKKPLPEFGEKESDYIERTKPKELTTGTPNLYPTNIPVEQYPGNIPQQATSGKARPEYTPSEITAMAKKLFENRRASGDKAFTIQEARQEIKDLNEENKNYNERVEKERSERVTSQKESGERAVKILSNVMTDANDEEKGIFRKKGEYLRSISKSEADFESRMAAEAKDFKNMLSNIDKTTSSPRWWKLHQNLQGNKKTSDQAAADMRLMLKPLLDYGLYDKARTKLESLGFAPEEREKIINDLDEKTKSYINTIPAVPTGTPQIGKQFQPSFKSSILGQREYTSGEINNLRTGLEDILKNNPNASLVLVRKAFEDKGYDWRIFKDTLNDILSNNENIRLSQDQFNQIDYLNSPPLGYLDQMLHGLGIIGR